MSRRIALVAGAIRTRTLNAIADLPIGSVAWAEAAPTNLPRTEDEVAMRADQKFPLTMFFLSLCALGVAAFLMRSHPWEPLHLPINLQQGATQSQSFSVGMDAKYLVELEADRALPFEQLNCLLGINPGTPMSCEGVAPVEVTWQVVSTEPKRIISAGSSRGHGDGAWGNSVSRTIGSFAAKKGQDYELKVVAINDGSSLMPAHPRIIVRQHPLQSKGSAIVAQTLLWFGIASIIVALVWLAFRRSQALRQ